MAMIGKPPAAPQSPIDREIAMRQRRIDRMEEKKRAILRVADEDVKSIDKRINEERVLMNAMKRGQLSAN